MNQDNTIYDDKTQFVNNDSNDNTEIVNNEAADNSERTSLINPKADRKAFWTKVAIGGTAGIILGVGGTLLATKAGAQTPAAANDTKNEGDAIDVKEDVEANADKDTQSTTDRTATANADDVKVVDVDTQNADAVVVDAQAEAPAATEADAQVTYGDFSSANNGAQAGHDASYMHSHVAHAGAPAAEPASAAAHPLVDPQVSVASNVDDSMSFSQAFASARAEVGPGGVFEWRGNLYGTYTADEWDHMSGAERADYNSHFAWSAGTHHNHPTEPANTVNMNEPTDDVAVVEHEAPVTDADDTDVQVLGVVYDEDSNMNMGAMLVDNQPVVLVDIDNDNVFDVVVADVNGDGDITEDEMADISGAGLTVDDVNSAAGDTLQAGDTVDFQDDMTYDV